MSVKKQFATFAGGCFWCMVKPFDQWDGVEYVVSGYTGGQTSNPSYEEVKTGKTGHYEAVQIKYDPEIISYETILNLYWPQIDPTDDGGQFHDRGSQYQTAIFYHSNEQKIAALESKKKISSNFNKPIVTKILEAEKFYVAEEYHQEFYKKNKDYYEKDRKASGRDDFIQKHWDTPIE
ncbi:peptide-methionine (S)-S-oxide reductase MsrA [Saliterribacillus persicus]|uniref:Peptide methionine sulfoxide reductase MsrA n=1 Tax=Saliterribacillus persicus TaxID=930114 RepID=A0A368XCK5_9BACI|nr:peptide-methionine (S)-S-oxide reductase MsrA [Saliterribacillus persicus]RCW63764.1 peptide-methionine (S)-S-oxide reductase [Saliterribacillus persicus]